MGLFPLCTKLKYIVVAIIVARGEGMKMEKMTEHEKQIEISICKACLKYLKKPHWSWDILFRPLRIFYFSRKLKKLHQAQVKQ